MAVLHDRECVAVAHVAGESRRVVRRARLRQHAAARRRLAQPVLQRAVDARDRQRREQHRPYDRVGPRRPSACRRVRWPSGGRAGRDPSRRRCARPPSARRPRRASASPLSAPAALVPRSSSLRPSCFRSISAVKLSLSRSMKRTIVAESRRGDVAERLRPVVDLPRPGRDRRLRCPAFRSASRKAVAAASAGVRVTMRPTRARSTTSADSGGDSSMKKLGFQPATIRRVSNALSSPITPPVTLRTPSRFDLSGEHAEVGARERWIAVALEDERAVPNRPVLPAGPEHVGLDPERRPELRQCRIRQRQLLVRGRSKRATTVLREENGAGREVERDGPRAGRSDVRDLERSREAELQCAVLGRPGGGRRRRNECDQGEDGCEETAAQAESIFRD